MQSRYRGAGVQVQSICKGSGEVIVQVIVQRRCRYGGAVTDMQRCR